MKKVLLIDDTFDNLLLTASALKWKLKCEVTKAENPVEIFNFIENNTYDLIICDYIMPEISGLDVHRRLRQKCLVTPFILFTNSEHYMIENINTIKDDPANLGIFHKTDIFKMIELIGESWMPVAA